MQCVRFLSASTKGDVSSWQLQFCWLFSKAYTIMRKMCPNTRADAFACLTARRHLRVCWFTAPYGWPCQALERRAHSLSILRYMTLYMQEHALSCA